MATGIVFGRISDRTGAGLANLFVVLSSARRVGTDVSGDLPSEPIGAAVMGAPPFGIATTTDTNGRYVLCYRWSGVHFGDQMAACLFRVLAFQATGRGGLVAAASRSGGVVGVDLRSLINGVSSMDAFAGGSDSANTWLNFIADRLRPLSRVSSAIRGMLGDGQSSERQVMATRIDIRSRR